MTFTSKLSLITLASSISLAAATPNEPISQCNTGDAQCCNSVTKASDPSATTILGLLGIVLQDVDVLVGLGCTPITVIGAGSGANCAQQPVCCENNSFNGLINIGCTPISL
ncbi:hypothetical protein M422DRAFT_273969 [Sphaerobolus stellatus SS14]|uniref:Hydrophobin n=1 Tax=Sphaerobolus stellatus (strain SS14) TaxID=990650 RepID=A0A0C9UI86_SPHS4|nr:hypothetical protein M422DRAFT_273969 [Sphaerobolus stellatus SS14]